MELQQAAAVTFHGWRVRCAVEAHDWPPAPPPPSSGATGGPDGPGGGGGGGRRGGGRGLGLGAFEVWVEWEVVGAGGEAADHDKIRTQKIQHHIQVVGAGDETAAPKAALVYSKLASRRSHTQTHTHTPHTTHTHRLSRRASACLARLQAPARAHTHTHTENQVDGRLPRRRESG